MRFAASLPGTLCTSVTKWPGSVARDHWRGVQSASHLCSHSSPEPYCCGKGQFVVQCSMQLVPNLSKSGDVPLHEPLETPQKCLLAFSHTATLTPNADCAGPQQTQQDLSVADRTPPTPPRMSSSILVCYVIQVTRKEYVSLTRYVELRRACSVLVYCCASACLFSL